MFRWFKSHHNWIYFIVNRNGLTRHSSNFLSMIYFNDGGSFTLFVQTSVLSWCIEFLIKSSNYLLEKIGFGCEIGAINYEKDFLENADILWKIIEKRTALRNGKWNRGFNRYFQLTKIRSSMRFSKALRIAVCRDAVIDGFQNVLWYTYSLSNLNPYHRFKHGMYSLPCPKCYHSTIVTLSTKCYKLYFNWTKVAKNTTKIVAFSNFLCRKKISVIERE